MAAVVNHTTTSLLLVVSPSLVELLLLGILKVVISVTTINLTLLLDLVDLVDISTTIEVLMVDLDSAS